MKHPPKHKRMNGKGKVREMDYVNAAEGIMKIGHQVLDLLNEEIRQMESTLDDLRGRADAIRGLVGASDAPKTRRIERLVYKGGELVPEVKEVPVKKISAPREKLENKWPRIYVKLPEVFDVSTLNKVAKRLGGYDGPAIRMGIARWTHHGFVKVVSEGQYRKLKAA
jgi:hypothetical protein